MRKLKLHWQILIAILLACIAGSLTGQDAALFGVRFYDAYVFIGTLFLNALKMLIVPLIMASIITGIANIQDGQAIAKLGGKTLLFYISSSFLAIMIGLVLVNWIAPGIVNGQPAGEVLGLNSAQYQIDPNIANKGSQDIVDIFIRLIPANVVASAAQGEMLGIIFFSLLFGFFMTQIKASPGAHLRQFWQSIFDVMMQMTLFIMRFAPIGVFGLVAKTMAETGFAAFMPLLSFFFTVLAALLIHMLITLPLLLKIFAKLRPKKHLQAMSPALLTAFSTASSSATLPMTMECAEKNAGISNKTCSFVLPLGATINMDGTALYECVAALFIAQAFGIELSISTQFLVVFIALITSIGVAGIPAASLVAISIILTSIGLPLEAIGIILITDRFLDMCRTAVNVYSDSCGAAIIDQR